MPWFAAVFLLVCLSSIAVPGFNGFVGEFLILVGSWTFSQGDGGGGRPSGVILAAVYMLWMVQRVFYGEVTNAKNANLPDLSAREWAVVAAPRRPRPLHGRGEPALHPPDRAHGRRPDSRRRSGTGRPGAARDRRPRPPAAAPPRRTPGAPAVNGALDLRPLDPRRDRRPDRPRGAPRPGLHAEGQGLAPSLGALPGRPRGRPRCPSWLLRHGPRPRAPVIGRQRWPPTTSPSSFQALILGGRDPGTVLLVGLATCARPGSSAASTTPSSSSPWWG